MTKLNPNFAYCIKKFAPPAGRKPVPAEVREAYRSRIPQSLLDFLEEYDAGLWLNGHFQFSEYGTARPLFDPALKKCGRLSYGECYGFFPAVGLGGLGMLDEVRKVRAAEHFAIIAQLEPIELRYMDTENPKIVVLRHLGSG